MYRYYIYTLGCKVNSCDSNDIVSNLTNFGFCVSDPENADLIVVNSCAVTAESVRKTRQKINKFKKINKNAFLILTGCASILDEFKNNSNIDLVSNKNHIINDIKLKFNLNKKQNDDFVFLDSKERTRFFMEIEDGCDNFCSYCIIPFTRGRIKSKSLDEINYECLNISKKEFKEIVLTGINLGRYGKDLGIDLIEAIKIVRKYFGRIRLSSLEPDVISNQFIDSLSSFPEICPHFHLSLQSGSDRILELMNRKYDVDFYTSLVDTIRSKFDKSTFATDLIVGFPGEDDKDFEDSIDLIKKIRFIRVNVFPFSPRPFTVAEKLKQIDSTLKKNRVKHAIKISEEVSKKEISNFFGSKLNVLFETREDDINESGYIYSGYSENYIKVKYRSDTNLCDKIKEVIFLPELP